MNLAFSCKFHAASWFFYNKPSGLRYKRHLWEPPSCVSPPRDQQLWGCLTPLGWWSECSWRCERSSLSASPEPHRRSWCGATGSPQTQPPCLLSLCGLHCCMDPNKRNHRRRSLIKSFTLHLKFIYWLVFTCSVRDQPEVWQCVRRRSDLAFLGWKFSWMSVAHSLLAALSFAISM